MFAGDVVEAMCSGVWGIVDQGSPFRLMDEEDMCAVERRTLGRNARATWCRKIDMVSYFLDDDATRDPQSTKSGYITYMLSFVARRFHGILYYRIQYNNTVWQVIKSTILTIFALAFEVFYCTLHF